MTAALEGWSWGTTDGGTWLTILGSHWGSPALAETAEQAVRPAAADSERLRDRMVLARVREIFHPGVTCGRAYIILERAAHSFAPQGNASVAHGAQVCATDCKPRS